MMPSRIAILSLACRFPEADSPDALWDNALAGRRAFRAIPATRIDLRAYTSDLVGEADSITPVKAGLLTNWGFDRARFRVPTAAFEAADLTHWLALDVAAEAINRAGGTEILLSDRTAVIVANTLAGEFSRAGLLRMRLPFLDGLLRNAATGAALDERVSSEVRRRFAEQLRERFPAPSEESLAGGLANTIAGRIANYFDFNGGAFTVDAACASSLVAIVEAAEVLSSGRADAVVVGAVDLSLDPFELVGFSRVGALASEEMRVFDARSDGFWPAEGAGFAVLVREADLRRTEVKPLAFLRGWGLSSDGAGGLTRPTIEGQVLAMRRAHERSGVDPADLAFVEAHGTGTATGDPTEVRALAAAHSGRRALPIGSIKANIGHAKAAAGFAGVIKTVEALRAGVIAPHVGCERPHPVFEEVEGRIRPALSPEVLPERIGMFAGVSSFGFGGINAHVILEAPATAGRIRPALRPFLRQDAELFVFAAASALELGEQLRAWRARAPGLASSELTDAAAAAWRAASVGTPGASFWRAAIVARSPESLARDLAVVAGRAADGEALFDPDAGLYLSDRAAAPRIGFLFPGQGAPVRSGGGAWARRFPHLAAALDVQPWSADPSDTSVVQPTVVAASLAALDVLARAGLEASSALGHSLGELCALAWAGAIPAGELTSLARDRGRIIADFGEAGGAMVRVGAGAATAAILADGLELALACNNGPAEVVFAGPAAAAEVLIDRARRSGVDAARLAVSHAFHSTMMQPALPPWRRRLDGAAIGSAPAGRVASSITGDWLAPDADLRALLTDQLVRPVAFATALARMADEADLLVEVGRGAVLTGLASAAGFRAVAVEAYGPSLFPLMNSLGAAFALGAPVDLEPLFSDRTLRPFDLHRHPTFISSPCGVSSVPPADPQSSLRPPPSASEPIEAADDGASPLEIVKAVVASETGLNPDAFSGPTRFLSDLHLNSLAVGRIVARSARRAGAPPFRAPTEFADASLEMLAQALEERISLPEHRNNGKRVAGVRRWVRAYAMQWRDAPAPERAPAPVRWRVTGLADSSAEEAQGPADGVLVELDGPPDEAQAEALLARIQAFSEGGIEHLAIRHCGWPLSAFARSLALERAFRSVKLIDAPKDDCVGRELSANVEGFSEVRLGADGFRRTPQFVAVRPRTGRPAPVTSDDTVLVIGGARGIAAECALRLAEATGCALLLCGRSEAGDSDVAAVLERGAARALRCGYVQADALDVEGLRLRIAEASRAYGPPTVLIHAPGVNEPMKLKDLTAEVFRRTMAVKTSGLCAAIAAAGPDLSRVIAFGSIIGRIGLAGEAHYALANAWQSMLMEQMAAARPACSFLALEWTVWGGVGMGERLGTIERMAASGVDALNVDDAVEAFLRLVADGVEGTLTVTSRFGPPAHLDLGPPPPAALRFQDEPAVHFPGVELVMATELSAGRDPYLGHHGLDGRAVLPGVMALESMSQAVEALAGPQGPRGVEDVRFARAVTLEEGESAPIRIAVLDGEDGSVEACLRSAADDFVEPCVSAVFRPQSVGPPPSPPAGSRAGGGFDAAPLYGPLLFQTGPFQRLGRFETAASREVAATIEPAPKNRWFGAFEPQGLLLGDPGVRDAALHALQAAVPHKRVIPTSVDSILTCAGGTPARVRAFELAADGSSYTFDIFIEDVSGKVVEVWRGATFRAIGTIDVRLVLEAQPLLASAYLERLGRELLLDDTLELELACAPGAAAKHDELRGSGRAEALRRLGIEAPSRRSDGRPLAQEGRGLSLAHQGGWTLAMASGREVACDIALIGVNERAAVTQARDRTASEASAKALEQLQAWCVGEALRKLGRFDPSGTWRENPNASAPSGAASIVTDDGTRILTAQVPAGADDLLVALAVAPPRVPGHPNLPVSHLAEARA